MGLFIVSQRAKQMLFHIGRQKHTEQVPPGEGTINESASNNKP